jgi:hypothetical protein
MPLHRNFFYNRSVKRYAHAAGCASTQGHNKEGEFGRGGGGYSGSDSRRIPSLRCATLKSFITSPTSPVLSGVALAKTEGPSSAAVVKDQLQQRTSLVDATNRNSHGDIGADGRVLGVANWLYLGADLVWRVWRVRVSIEGLSQE